MIGNMNLNHIPTHEFICDVLYVLPIEIVHKHILIYLNIWEEKKKLLHKLINRNIDNKKYLQHEIKLSLYYIKRPLIIQGTQFYFEFSTLRTFKTLYLDLKVNNRVFRYTLGNTNRLCIY